MIYSELLVCPTAFGREGGCVAAGPEVERLWFGPDWGIEPPDAPRFEPAPPSTALLYVNRLVSMEARAVLYSQPIHFYKSHDMAGFLETIGPFNRTLLRDVGVFSLYSYGLHFGMDIDPSLVTQLVEATGLRKLRIGQYDFKKRHSTDSSSVLAKELLEKTAPLFESWAETRGKSDAAIDVLRLGVANFVAWAMDLRLILPDHKKAEQESKDVVASLRYLLTHPGEDVSIADKDDETVACRDEATATL
ncbi:hypothetical protein MBLNU459_g6623t1 [Dothideomycetes sp. NU459]